MFFDLVFVFTLTQVSTIVIRSPNGAGIARAAIELALIYWMYGWYAWMTNAAGPDTWQRRVLLLVGMAAFFVCALAVPRAFDEDRLVFGAGYLVATLVYLWGLLRRPGGTPLASVHGIAPGNLVSAGLVFTAGWAHGNAIWALWGSALALEIVAPLLTRRIQGFEFNAAHFSERHGVMILIVLGESLISVGLYAGIRRIDAGLLGGALAGLAASAAMWWAYFVREDTRAANAFAAAPPHKRVRQALIGYELANVVMIYGVLAVAAGTRLRFDQMAAAMPAFEAWLVALGGTLFLLGGAGFRLAFGFGTPWPRALGALFCLAAAPAGIYGSATADLTAIAIVIAVTLAIERAVETVKTDRPVSRRRAWTR